MDYRIIAVDELRNFEQNCTAEKTIKLRILELDSILKSSGGGAGNPTHNPGGGNKTEHKWLSLISSISDEKERLSRVASKIKRVEMALLAVTEEERRILKAAYIDGRSMDEVATKEHMSRATAYRIRDNALIGFTRALYGAVVS